MVRRVIKVSVSVRETIMVNTSGNAISIASGRRIFVGPRL